MLNTRPMSLKFRLFSFLSQNTLSRKHDFSILFTWANHIKSGNQGNKRRQRIYTGRYSRGLFVTFVTSLLVIVAGTRRTIGKYPPAFIDTRHVLAVLR